MRLSLLQPKFSGVYAVKTQGLSNRPRQTSVRQISDAELRAFAATQQERLVSEATRQIAPYTHWVSIPEKFARFLAYHWHHFPTVPTPPRDKFKFWASDMGKRIDQWRSGNPNTENAYPEAERLKAEVQRVHQAWQKASGFRYLLFIDDKKFNDATAVQHQIRRDLGKLDEGQTVHLPYVGSLKPADPKRNRFEYYYGLYVSTLQGAHQAQGDHLSNPRLDGSFALSLASLSKQKDGSYQYQVNATLSSPDNLVKPQNIILRGSVPSLQAQSTLDQRARAASHG